MNENILKSQKAMALYVKYKYIFTTDSRDRKNSNLSWKKRREKNPKQTNNKMQTNQPKKTTNKTQNKTTKTSVKSFMFLGILENIENGSSEISLS